MVMNAKDALGYMEDMAIIHAAQRNTEEARSRSVTTENMGMVVAAVALKERENRLALLQYDRNNQVIHATALKKTLDHVIRDFAKLAGVAEDKLMERYNIVRTQHYNSCVNEGMEKGWFEKDPRFQSSDKSNWYKKGLDTDHGF